LAVHKASISLDFGAVTTGLRAGFGIAQQAS
jgi:hypothetical protein